jgi:predicted DsbA family dithiol-disulfide isomerase
MTAAKPLQIDVISDVMCPWCFIGKRRLEKAAAQSSMPLEVRWKPFQLDPTLPPEGKDRRRYLEEKFGSEERIAQLYGNLAEVGKGEGIPFAFERIAVSPNTLDAHRLIRWAGEAGKQDQVVEALFRAYFLEGRNIGDHAVLSDIAASAGMDKNRIASRLESDEDRDVVQNEIAAAQDMGVTGVPTFILVGRYALVGAQPPEELAHAFDMVAEKLSAA